MTLFGVDFYSIRETVGGLAMSSYALYLLAVIGIGCFLAGIDPKTGYFCAWDPKPQFSGGADPGGASRQYARGAMPAGRRSVARLDLRYVKTLALRMA